MSELKGIEKELDYPLDTSISITKGMVLSTNTGKVKVLEYRGSEVWHKDPMGKEKIGYAPKSQPDSIEWRRYTLLIEAK